LQKSRTEISKTRSLGFEWRLGFGATRVNSLKTKPVTGNPVKVLARMPGGSKDEKYLKMVLPANTKITSDKFSFIDPELVDSAKNISSDFVLQVSGETFPPSSPYRLGA
jgi:hypothetical protein